MPRLVASRRGFDGRLISVRLDEIEFPSGRRAVFEVVEHPGAVAMVALTAERHVLLVRQFRPAVGVELLELPAGTRERGETSLACARRELAEEVGRAANRWEPLIAFYPSPGVFSEELHLFLAQDLHPAPGAQGPPPTDHHEEDLRVESMPLEEAHRRIGTGGIRDAKSIIGIIVARERLARPD